MMTTKALLLAASLLVVGAVPAHSQNFLMNSAETINKGNFKIGVYPTVLLGEDGADNEWGVAGRFGYGFTPSLDVEAKVAFFDGFKLYGADAEFWLVKGDLDVSVAAGVHRAEVDGGFDSTAFDVSGLASGYIAEKLELYGGTSLSFESLSDSDFDDDSFTRTYLVAGLEYRVRENVDLLTEFGLGLNDDSPNYFSFGVAFYLR
jgi:hypothetical protein